MVKVSLQRWAPGIHWIGGSVGPRAVLNAVVERKIPSPRLESNPRTPDRPARSPVLYRLSYHGSQRCPYAFLNWPPRHEGVLGSGGIAPRTFDLGTEWRWVVRFMPRPLYSQAKSSWYPLDRRLDGPQSRPGHGDEEEKNSRPPAGSRSRSPELYRWAILAHA
jgi:hypothetical protein